MSSAFSLLSFFFAQATLFKVQKPDEPEHERHTLQVPEDAVWPSTLAYHCFPLEFSSKEGWSYVILGSCHTGLGRDVKDLAMALSSGSKDLDDRIQELAPRMMDEARKDPESVIVQDLWFSQLDWSPKKKKAEELE